MKTLLNHAAGVLLPATRSGRVLAFGVTTDAVGSGMFTAAATLYFVVVVGIPTIAAATVLAIANICGLLSPVPLGRLADRIGPPRVLVALLLLRAVGYAAYIFVADFVGYLLLTSLLTACDRASAPLLQTVVGQVEGSQERTRTLAAMRALRNVGMTAGFLLAGVVQATQSHSAFVALFLINALTLLVVAVCIARVTVREPSPRVSSSLRNEQTTDGTITPRPSSRGQSPLRNPRFILVTIGEGLFDLHDSVLLVLLPLWLVQQVGAPATVASVLLAINTVLTVGLQVYVSRFATGLNAALRLLTAATWILLAMCAVFAIAERQTATVAITLAGLAVILLTIGENIHAVAGWELSFALAPDSDRAQYLATFSLGHTVQRSLGPLLMTGVVLVLSTPGWWALAALFLLARLLTQTGTSGLSFLSTRATRRPRPEVASH